MSGQRLVMRRAAYLQLPNALLGRTGGARNTLWHDRATRRSRFPLSRGLRFGIFAKFDFLDPNFALYKLVNVRHHNRTLNVHQRERWRGITRKRGDGRMSGWFVVGYCMMERIMARRLTHSNNLTKRQSRTRDSRRNDHRNLLLGSC